MLWKEYNFDKIIAIGDVHGHYETLMALIEKLPKDIPIFFLGDLIDKGKRSKEVVEYVKNHHYSARGNHDNLMAIEASPNWKRYESLWLENNGKMTHRSYGGKYKLRNSREFSKIYYDHVNWIKSLPLVMEFPNIQINGRTLYLSHSSIDEAIKQKGSLDNLKNFLINSDHSLIRHHTNLKTAGAEELAIANIMWKVLKEGNIKDNNIFNVFGHTAAEEARIENHYACIDTKVYGPNKLTALILPEMKIISQETLEDTWGHKKS